MCAGSGYSLMIFYNDDSLDFSHAFPGIQRYQCHLDRVHPMQVQAPCFCWHQSVAPGAGWLVEQHPGP